ncbi:MAG: Ig-like domain-containing protein [Tepidisphaeraceae bacterium]
MSTVEGLESRRLFSVSATPVNEIGVSPGVYASATAPSVMSVTQPSNTANARRDLTVVLALNLPNGPIKFDALYRSAFRIFEANTDGTRKTGLSDSDYIDTGNLQTSGGGDTLSITPNNPLKANQNYRVEVNQAYVSSGTKIKDIAGNVLAPYAFTFKTGSEIAIADPDINFTKTQVTTSGQAAAYTAVTTGPDGKLYAATLDGYIYRWTIESDGTLSNRQTITTVRDNDSVDHARIITGITFDPDATAGSLKLWVSHGQYKLGSIAGSGSGRDYQADNYTGKISVLSGANLDSYNDVIVGIPRSVKDHLNNQIAFDTSGNNFFFCIPSMSAMGAADTTWGSRPENALSAAYIRVNLAKLDTELSSNGGPIDLTNATYDATNSANALNIWATGVRNAYDIVFHSNGHMYSAVNGSSAGGNTPAGGGAPALTAVPQTEEDVLLDVESGKYYGHPNPTRGEYVLGGGNPTADADPYEFAQTTSSQAGHMYPVGTQPDADYTLPAYDIGKNVSPNGMIEYTGSAFGGKLNGTLLICRYNSGQDILAITPNSDGSISKSGVQARITGLTGLSNPIDIVQSGNNLYVAQLDSANNTGSIVLMKPTAVNSVATPGSENSVPYRVVVYPTPGDRNGMTRTVSVTNDGTTTLAIDAHLTKINGSYRRNFIVTDLGTDDIYILPGESRTFTVKGVLTADQTLVNHTNLAFKINQPATPYLSFQLRASAPSSVSASRKVPDAAFSSVRISESDTQFGEQDQELLDSSSLLS